jgi:hypothetical protein
VDRSAGVICDQTIAMDGYLTPAKLSHPPAAHSIQGPRDRQNADLPHQSNDTAGLDDCALYKSRWQVELFFKWIKQHLRIKQFYGISENAVKTQIWIAVSVYVLVAIVRKRLGWRCRSTHCYRSFRSQFSRKCRSSLRSWRHQTDPMMPQTATNWNYSLFDRTAVCRVHRARLVVSRLDRLGRDASWLLGLERRGSTLL